MTKTIVPVILSGGVGSRLWPLSRQAYPKQFMVLPGQEKSLLRTTLSRVSGFNAPILVCNEEHRFLVAEQVRAEGVSPLDIILEPCGRSTAPAVALAALELAGRERENDIMLVLPSDHVIADEAAFMGTVEAGMHLVEKGRLVTMGVTPPRPETGYGYIELGNDVDGYGHNVARFVEKPDAATAEKFIAAGNFLWNAGIFMFTARAYLEALETFAPEMLKHCRVAYAERTSDLDFTRPGKRAFENCPENSIDYAIAEKAENMAVVPLSAHWNDVGGWQAVWEEAQKDEAGNATIGDVMLESGSRDNLVLAEHGMISMLGMENCAVVQTRDATLIARMDTVQDVKKVVAALKERARSEHLTHTRVYRPWGSYEGMDAGEGFQVKRLSVKPGGVLSLQLHHKRSEHWVVVKGTATVTLGEESFELKPDASVYIPVGTRHRLENKTEEPLELIEVQTGSYLGEDDIVRFEDVYGRTEEKPAEKKVA